MNNFDTGNIVSCRDYVGICKEHLKEQVADFSRKPCLAIIQVGDNPASNSYVKGKFRDCDEIGITHCHYSFNEDVTEEMLLECIDGCNANKTIDGIIVQLPLPKHLDEIKITHHIVKEKDVDGFRPDSLFKPCTPGGIMQWLSYNGYHFKK